MNKIKLIDISKQISKSYLFAHNFRSSTSYDQFMIGRMNVDLVWWNLL